MEAPLIDVNEVIFFFPGRSWYCEPATLIINTKQDLLFLYQGLPWGPFKRLGNGGKKLTFCRETSRSIREFIMQGLASEGVSTISLINKLVNSIFEVITYFLTFLIELTVSYPK